MFNRLANIFNKPESGKVKLKFIALDEEYYPLLSAIRENIEVYTAMDEQARLAWVRNYMEAV